MWYSEYQNPLNCTSIVRNGIHCSVKIDWNGYCVILTSAVYGFNQIFYYCIYYYFSNNSFHSKNLLIQIFIQSIRFDRQWNTNYNAKRKYLNWTQPVAQLNELNCAELFCLTVTYCIRCERAEWRPTYYRKGIKQFL